MGTKLKTKPSLTVVRKREEIRVPPGELGAILELIVRDRDGKITQQQKMLSRSFVKQFLQGLWVCSTYIYAAQGMPGISIKDTSGNLQRITSHQQNWRCDALINDDTFGIMVGTGITAPTIDDYQMEAKIAHGVAAGQIQYSAVTFGAPTEDGITSHFTITRDFANASGATITVREIGLVVKLFNYAGGTYYFLTIRDAVNIALPDGETLTVNYRIQATV